MTFYRLLLAFYPASFRYEYADELSSVFAARLKQSTGMWAKLLLWMDVFLDVMITAAQSHFDILRQDLLFAQRTLMRSPGFSVTAIAVVALGVGATTTAYTITDHVLLRPLPFPEAAQLVKLWEDMSPGAYDQMEPSPANYRDWKQMNHSFIGMGAFFAPPSVSMVGVGDPKQVDAVAVTADVFPMLGVQAFLGRIFSAQDDRSGAPGTAVLSYGMWQRQFGADPNVLGKRLVLNGEGYTVIGVAPKTFGYPRPVVQVWITARFGNDDFQDRNDNYLRVVAKLAPGVSREQAQNEMRVISERLKRQYPKDNEHVGVKVNPLVDEVSQRSRVMLYALSGASLCVLLIACANLANLLLARTLQRRKEIAMRKSLGAGRERVVRQMLTESLLLAFVGGSLGVAMASAMTPLLTRFVPTMLPVTDSPTVDLRVILFSLALTTATGILFGVIPAARAASTSTVDGLQEGGRQGIGGRKERLRSALVIAEIAISLVLLTSCGLLVRALWEIQKVNPGFRAENVLTLSTALPMPKYAVTARRVRFYREVLDGIRSLPGVVSAGYTSNLPVVRGGGIWPVSIEGRPKETDRAFHQASLRYITPGYLEAMSVPLLHGRSVSESDTLKTQMVAVVSESFVKEYFPHEDPIGHHFDFGLATRTVVGVVGNVRVRGVERISEPQVYLPYQQVPDEYLIGYTPQDVAIRSSASMEALLPSIRRIVAGADQDQPISHVQTMTEILDSDTAPRLANIQVLVGFTLVAITLAGVGIYGLLTFTVSNRTQEIGVRMAMGAQGKDVLAVILRESAILTLVGTAAGMVAAYFAARTLQSLLAGINPADAATFVTAALVIIVTVLAGSLAPAFRALQVDPMVAMRSE